MPPDLTPITPQPPRFDYPATPKAPVFSPSAPLTDSFIAKNHHRQRHIWSTILSLALLVIAIWLIMAWRQSATRPNPDTNNGAEISIGNIDSKAKNKNGATILNQTIYLQTADSANVGLLTATDWNTFNAKQPAGFYLTNETDPAWAAASTGYFNLNQAEIITGIPAFNGGTSGLFAPFRVDSTYLVTNLNADLLDGFTAADFAPVGGSSSYVQLQGSTPGSQQTGHLNISGTGIFGTNILTPIAYGSASANGTLTLQGNSAAAGNTATNANLTLKVGDSGTTTAMTILNNGNIGINTTTPLVPFQVTGISSFGDSVTTANSSRALNLNSTTAVIRVLRVVTNTYTAAPAIELISRQTSDGSNLTYWDFFTGIGNVAGLRQRVTNPTTVGLLMTADGKTGFNTATDNYFQIPTYDLTVGAGAGAAKTFGVDRGWLSNTAGANLTINAGGATPNGQIYRVTATPVAAGSGYTINNVLTLDGGTGGTVYVGAVNGSGGVTAVYIRTYGSGYSVGTLTTTGGTGTGCTVTVSNTLLSINKNGGDLYLTSGIGTGTGSSNIYLQTNPAGSTGSVDTTPTTRMTILNNGKVGINTAAPTSQLTVTGSSSVATVGVSNLLTADSTFSTTTGWTAVGALPSGGWDTTTPTANKANHATGNTVALSGTSTATSTSTMYQINFTVAVTTAGDGFTVSLGGTDSGNTFTTAGAKTVYVRPGAGSGTLAFTPGVAGTFVGTIDDVTIYAITASTADVAVINSNGTLTPLEVRAGGSALNNSFVGTSAGRLNTTGTQNSAVGAVSLYSNTTGNYNSAMGVSSLQTNTTGTYNSAMGYQSLYSNTTGVRNSAVGVGSLYSNTTGGYNSAVGYGSGRYITGGGANATSNNSVYLGYDTRALADGDTNEIVIGYTAIGAGTNTVTLGNTSITKTILQGSVGIANTAPDYLLHVGSSAVTTGTAVARFENAGGTCTITPNTAGGITCTSDERLKKDITTYDDALNQILGLRTVSYRMLAESDTAMLHVGFIAQEYEDLFPDLVYTDSEGIKSISYAGLTPYLAKAIQQQQQTISELNTKVATLNNRLQYNSDLNLTTITGNLAVTGNTQVADITVNGHIISAGDTPIILAGIAAGEGAITEVLGNDTSGTITITTGDNTTADSLVELTFNNSFSKQPKIILTSGNADTSNLKYYRSATTDKFMIYLTEPPQANTTYTFDYLVIE